MLYVVLALLALGALTGGAGLAFGRKFLKGKGWRPGAAGLSVIALLAGMLMLARTAWAEAAVFLALSAGLGAAARARRTSKPSGKPKPSESKPAGQVPALMDRAQAAAILGVARTAGADEVQAAYLRLMRLAHPDKGGTSGLAAQLNAAREALLEP